MLRRDLRLFVFRLVYVKHDVIDFQWGHMLRSRRFLFYLLGNRPEIILVVIQNVILAFILALEDKRVRSP